MSEIDKMNRYIKKTNIPSKAQIRYSLVIPEMRAFFSKGAKGGMENLMDAFLLAFDYGMAKGYRAGTKAVKRK